jgi:hypothetical protein
MRKILIATLWVALLLMLAPVPMMAQEPVVCETDYVVRRNDWLKKIAAEHYGDSEAYLDIVEATNAKARVDASYAFIANPNVIQPGWKLCLPPGGAQLASTPQPPATPQYQVGITIASEALPPHTISEARLFPLRGAPDFFIGPAEAFLDSPEDSPGTVRLALARPISDRFRPEALNSTTTASWSWILFTPNSDEATALDWREFKTDRSADATSEALFIQRVISETIVLAPDKPSRQALLDELEARFNPDTGAGLWVDFVLMEETDAQGAKSWALYNIALEPDAPAGEDGGITFCCRWLGCGSASAGYCDFWGCGGVCQ